MSAGRFASRPPGSPSCRPRRVLAEPHGSIRRDFRAPSKPGASETARQRANALLVSERPASAGVARVNTPPRDVLEAVVRDWRAPRGSRVSGCARWTREGVCRSTATARSSARGWRRRRRRCPAARDADRVGGHLSCQVPRFNLRIWGDPCIPLSRCGIWKRYRGSSEFRPGPEPEARSPAVPVERGAANHLGANPADPVSLDYYVWEQEGPLSTRSAEFSSPHCSH